MAVSLRLLGLLLFSTSSVRLTGKRVEALRSLQADTADRDQQEANKKLGLCRVSGPPNTNVSFTIGLPKMSCKFACTSFVHNQAKITGIMEKAFEATKHPHARTGKECLCQDATTEEVRLPPFGKMRDCNPSGCWRHYETVVKKMFVDDTPGGMKWEADKNHAEYCILCGVADAPACESTSITTSFGMGDLMKRTELAKTDAKQASELQKLLFTLKGEDFLKKDLDRHSDSTLFLKTEDSIEAAKAKQAEAKAAEEAAAKLAEEKAKRIAAEEEIARIAAEKLEAKRIAAEKEVARIAAEKLEAERIAAKKERLEAARIAEEKLKASGAAESKPRRDGKDARFFAVVDDDDDEEEYEEVPEEEEEDEEDPTGKNQTTEEAKKVTKGRAFANDDDEDEEDYEEVEEVDWTGKNETTEERTCPNLQAVTDAYQAVVDRIFSATGACKVSEKHLEEQTDGSFTLSVTTGMCAASCIKSFMDKPMILPDVTSQSILKMGHCDESDRLTDLEDLIKVVEGVIEVGASCA